eukprot:s3058_g11.t1
MASTDGHRSLGTTFFCGDATNSSIWQKQKVQGLLVSTSLITNWKALEETWYDDAFIGMTAMTGELPSDYVHVFMCTGDNGPDQVSVTLPKHYCTSAVTLATTQDAEDFYLQTGAGNVAKLFQEVFRKSGDVGNEPIADQDKDRSGVLDELSMDEAAHYKQKIGKYIRASLRCVVDPVFWFLMKAAHTVRGPWLHFYRFLCMKSNAVSASGQRRLPIVELVSRVTFTINASFEHLVLSIPAWVDDACIFASQTDGPEHPEQGLDRLLVTSIAASLLLQNAATFHRRIVRPYSRHMSTHVIRVFTVLFLFDLRDS